MEEDETKLGKKRKRKTRIIKKRKGKEKERKLS